MKKIFIIICLCVAVIGLYGCGDSADESETSTNDPNDFESYTVYFGKNINEAFGNDLEKQDTGNMNETTYDAKLKSTWNGIEGNVKVVADSNGSIVRCILEFDDTYLNGDDYTKACDYLKSKYGEGKALTADITDYYFDKYYFRLMRNQCVLGLDEEHLSSSDKQNDATTKTKNKSEYDWSMFTKLLGKDFSELPDYYDMTNADIGTASADFQDKGKSTVFRDADSKKINIVSYQPKANDNGYIKQTEVDAWVKMVSDTYGKAVKSTLDNTSKQHQNENDVYRCDHYVVYDGDKMLVQVLAEKEDGTNINDVSIVFYDAIIK